MKAFVAFIIVTLAIAMPLIANYGFKLQGKKMKTVLGLNLFSFFGLLAIMTVCMWTGDASVFAAGAADAANTAAASGADGMKYLSAALSTGLACIGSGIAVATASSAALGAISEDPKIMGKSLIFVALAEGLALYGLLISLLLLFAV